MTVFSHRRASFVKLCWQIPFNKDFRIKKWTPIKIHIVSKSVSCYGAGDGTWTHMTLRSLAPEASASANSATPAYLIVDNFRMGAVCLRNKFRFHEIEDFVLWNKFRLHQIKDLAQFRHTCIFNALPNSQRWYYIIAELQSQVFFENFFTFRIIGKFWFWYGCL